MTTRAKSKQALSAENEDLRARLAKTEDALAAYVTGHNSASSNGSRNLDLLAFGTAGNLHSAMLAQISDAVIAVDNAQRVTYINATAERQYAISATEAIGRKLDELYQFRWLHPEDEAAAFAALRGHGVWRGANIHVRRDGVMLHVESTVSTLRDDAGDPFGVLAVIRDMTEHKQAEERVRQSEVQLRRVLDNLFAFVGVMLPDGTLIEANRAPIEVAGVTASDVIGKKFWDCYWWSYSPQVQAQLRDAVARANLGEIVRYDVPVRAAGDARIWIDFQLSPLRDEAGVITHLIPSGIDITERKDAETQLRDANEQFEKTNALLEAVLAGAPSGIVIFDTDLRYVRVNESLARINHQPVEAHIGRTTTEVLGPARAAIINPILQQVLETGMTITGMEISESDGYVLADFYPVRTTAGSTVGVGVTVTDITGRKRREAHAAFLGEIGDVLAQMSTPEDIMHAAGEKISAHLNASRVCFIEIDVPNDASIVLYSWCMDDFPSTAGRYCISEYSDDSFLNTLAAGDSFVINDTATDPRLTPDAAGKFAAMQIGSALNTPYLSNGQLKFVLAVQQRAAHEWRDDEIDLMRDLAVRLWPAIQRTHAEKALRQSEDRFRLASKAVQAVIYDWDMLSDHVAHSDEIFNLLGFSNNEAGIATNDWYRSRMHPEDVESAVQRFNAAVASGAETYEDEFRLQHKDGHYLWVLDNALFLRDHAGKPVRCVGSITDITERHEAEAALRESEARLKLALESGRMGAWDWDLLTGNEHWSPEQEKLFGLPPGTGTYTAEQFVMMVHPEDKTRIASESDISSATGQDFIEEEFRIIKPDGSVVWIASRSRMHRDASGRVVRMTGVNMDVTERKRAEDELKESEMRFRRLTEASIIGIITADSDKFITSNDAFLSIVGYTREDLDAGLVRWPQMTPAEFAELDQRGLAQLLERGWCEPFERNFFERMAAACKSSSARRC